MEKEQPVFAIIQGRLKPDSEEIYQKYLQGVAPLMKEYEVEIIAFGAGFESEHTNTIFPINGVLKAPNKSVFENFLSDERYIELKKNYRDVAYQELRLSVFYSSFLQ